MIISLGVIVELKRLDDSYVTEHPESEAAQPEGRVSTKAFDLARQGHPGRPVDVDGIPILRFVVHQVSIAEDKALYRPFHYLSV